MEFILTDEKGIEKGPLLERDYIDIDCGEDNTFEIQVTNKYYKKHGITYGWRLGVQGKEYGGVIKRIITNTETDLVALMGPTWRGMLEKKIIEPPHGQDYRVVSGDANTIINNIVCSEFDGIFVCDGESGVSLNNFQFDRYVTQLAGIEKMLLSKNARLDIAYDSGEPNEASFVKLAAVPIKDYSDEIEYSQDGTLGFLSFTFEDFRGGINHLICLGKGELKDRLVLHLYADENGNIGTEQHFFGAEEREATYDYSSASSEEDLRKNGTEKFKELLSYKSMDMDLFNETLAGLRGINDDISIGDIVGGRDFDTGIYLSKQITRKIVQVKNGRESIEYGVGKLVLNRNSANAPEEQQSYLQGSDVVDNLLSTSTNLPLSANQGNILSKDIKNVSDNLGNMEYSNQKFSNVTESYNSSNVLFHKGKEIYPKNFPSSAFLIVLNSGVELGKSSMYMLIIGDSETKPKIVHLGGDNTGTFPKIALTTSNRAYVVWSATATSVIRAGIFKLY